MRQCKTEILDLRPRLRVPRSEYMRLLGLPPNYQCEGRVQELAEWAEQWYVSHGEPWMFARQVEEYSIGSRGILLDGELFESAELRRMLERASASGVLIGGAGAGPAVDRESERLWEQERPDEHFFLDRYAAAVVEHLITELGARLCELADGAEQTVLPHYSPGYAGWALGDQKRLFWWIRRQLNPTPFALDLFESGQLRPKKSQLALFAIAPISDLTRRLRDLVPCQTCSSSPCSFRRAPFEPGDHGIDGAPFAGPVPETIVLGSPTVPAAYRVSRRALERWSTEALALEPTGQGLEARFRYPGTTCSNMGVPLVFDFRVRLSSRTDGYRILETRCEPAPEDEGFRSMCAFIEDENAQAASWLKPIELVGSPLNEVLKWDPPLLFSGCLCKEADRNHKWRLVLETIHFRLAHDETERIA